MRFDPRLIHPDDDRDGGHEGGNAGLPVGDLPPHLEALAQQLEADAARLSGKYPPGGLRSEPSEESVPAPAASRRRPWHASWLVRAAAAAVVLLAVGTAAFDLVRSRTNSRNLAVQGGHEPGQPVAESSRIVQVAERAGDRAVQPDIGSQTQRDSQPRQSPPAGLPAMLFHDLSAPQQEAVLDLLEEHGLEHADLSI